MREILFRGKRKGTDEWVYGDLMRDNIHGEKTSIWKEMGPQVWRAYEVDPETVGQFTGVLDREGKKIFEGDILDGGPLREFNEDNRELVVKWYDSLGYDGKGGEHSGFYFESTWGHDGELDYHENMKDHIVIGNIHDKK